MCMILIFTFSTGRMKQIVVSRIKVIIIKKLAENKNLHSIGIMNTVPCITAAW